uniref:Uncharacterized protein n=1 Tax=Oryza punctata TaxID=4537 RepID=A0A0E0MPW0_ORYPU
MVRGPEVVVLVVNGECFELCRDNGASAGNPEPPSLSSSAPAPSSPAPSFTVVLLSASIAL